MPADAIIMAYQDLTQALQGLQNIKGNVNMKALTKMQHLFAPERQIIVNTLMPWEDQSPPMVWFEEVAP